MCDEKPVLMLMIIIVILVKIFSFQDQHDYCDTEKISDYKGAEHTMCKFCVSLSLVFINTILFNITTLLYVSLHIAYHYLHEDFINCVYLINEMSIKILVKASK